MLCALMPFGGMLMLALLRLRYVWFLASRVAGSLLALYRRDMHGLDGNRVALLT